MKPDIIPPLMNLPRAICDNLIGEHHTLTHRFVVGAVIMVAGVGIAHCGDILPEGFGLCLETLGSAIHGIGLTPIVEAMVLLIRRQ